MTPLLAIELFTSHWTIVLSVGCAFFCLQIALCLRFVLWIGGYRSTLLELSSDVDRGGDGRENIELLAGRFPWLKWVNGNFPKGTTTPGNYTRDDVLQELDTRIASSSSYLFLQRLGVMAPLLGVILTVLGFGWIEMPETDEPSLSQMLDVVTPLVAGVGTGALLALINQGLLHIAGARVEALRMIARTWFDEVIWSSVGLDTQAATVKAIAAIEKMAKSVSLSADQQIENTTRLVETTAAMRVAADEFSEMVQAMGTDVKGLPETLAELRIATAKSAAALEELIPVGQRAVAGLDVSVSAFRTTVDNEFIEAAKMHRSSIESMADSVSAVSARSREVLGDSAEQLQQAAKALTAGTQQVAKVLSEQADATEQVGAMQLSVREAVERLLAAGQALDATVKSDVGPSQREMHAAATAFADSAQRLASFIKEGLQPATKRLADLNKTLAGLESTVQTMRDFNGAGAELDELAEAMRGAAEAGQAIAELPAQLSEALDERLSLHEAVASNTRGLASWFRGRSVD